MDIVTEVSILALQMAIPHQGQLDTFIRIFDYLKIKHNWTLVLDPSYPEIDYMAFLKHDWTSMYGEVQERILENAPIPRGKEVNLHFYVDSDHAGCKKTRRSRTGFFVTEFRQPLQVQSHLEMPRILVQLGHTQHT